MYPNVQQFTQELANRQAAQYGGGGGGTPVLTGSNQNLVNNYLDQGSSYEDIASQTGFDLEAIRNYADTSRPGYGVPSTSTFPTGTSEGSPNPNSTSWYSGSGSGGSTPAYSPEDMAYLDAQDAKLQSSLGRTDTYLQNALDALLQNYNKELSVANTTRSRNLEDFNMKTEQSETGRSRELDKNDTRARSLANGLRQRIGLASGSGSSAFQVTAPKAVQQEASQGRSDILGDYAANFQNLAVNKRRSGEDFEMLLSELDKQKLAREGGVRGDIEEQRNAIRENQRRVAGQRQQLMGGGYNGVRSAMQPFESQIQQGESLLDGIYSKYAAKYNVNPLQVRTTSLRDYATDKLAVRDQQQTGNEYAPYKAPFGQDEEEQQVTF